LLHRHYPASSLLRAPPPPSRLQLISQRAGYRADLPPEISPWDEEGFSSCVVCPCSRAVALTPPEWSGVSALFHLPMRSSSYGQGLDLRGSVLSRLPLRSLPLRPGNSLTIPTMALSMGFSVSVSLHAAIQTTGHRLLPWWACFPLNRRALPGHTTVRMVFPYTAFRCSSSRRHALRSSQKAGSGLASRDSFLCCPDHRRG
jgi:hypothetical protein